jgi:hypothetical protein
MKKIFLITGLGILGLGILGLGAVIFGLVYFDGQAKTEAFQNQNKCVVVLKSDQDPDAVADAMSKEYGLTVGHTYKQELKGFVAIIPPEKLVAVSNDPRVAYVDSRPPMGSIEPPGLQTPTWQFRQRLDQAIYRLRAAVNNFLASEW